jgi:hypothetical protein
VIASIGSGSVDDPPLRSEPHEYCLLAQLVAHQTDMQTQIVEFIAVG